MVRRMVRHTACHMPSSIPVPDRITPGWLTAILRESGVLTGGQVQNVTSQTTGAFNSHTQQLQLFYSDDAPSGLAKSMILKANKPELWAVEAGAEEVKFYQTAAGLHPSPPALVPCYAALYNPESGNSYLLLRDLSDTHLAPVTRDQQISIVHSVPSTVNIERVIVALARHHAYWWNHPLLPSETFHIGYWSRDANRFDQYLQRRQTAWESLRVDEARWFPSNVRNLYDRVLAYLRHHWRRYLEPRFSTYSHLTLVHGDSYFSNFLCPRHEDGGTTYLLDWQSPTFDIGGYDLANLCATFWTSAQRHEAQRERKLLERYHRELVKAGVSNYSWDDLISDYQSGLIYWLLVPVQDRYDGSSRDYWYPKMQCLVTAFQEWHCEELLGR